MPEEKDNVETLGPGAAQVAERMQPLLDGLDENYYVEIINPFSVPFVGRVASTRPQNMPVRVVQTQEMRTITQNEEDVRRNYGLDLRNPDHQSNVHFAQTIEIQPGKTIRLPGNEAQVIVRQMVNVLMDKEDKKLFKGDSFARRQYEERIVLRQGTMSEFFQTQSVDVRRTLNADLDNQTPVGVADEQSFPTEAEHLGTSGTPGNGSTDQSGQPENGVRRGRPPKNQN